MTGSTLADNCFLVNHNIVNTGEFKIGQITVQDEVANLIADCSGLQENDYALNTCAAPSGEISQLAENLP